MRVAGIAAALSLLLKLSPHALAYRQIARLFRCLVLVQDLSAAAALTHEKSRSRVIAQMGICQAAADAFLTFEAGFVGQPSPILLLHVHPLIFIIPPPHQN